MSKRNFELQKYETENWDESPLPGETLIFKDTGEYTPPEEPKEKKKEKKEESRSLREMYEQDADLIREVIAFWGLKWPQIQFVAMHGMPTKPLAQWRSQAEEEFEARQAKYAVKSWQGGGGYAAHRPFEVTGTPVRFSKLKLIQFYRKYEPQIWESASAFISSTEGGEFTPFEALAKCISFANIKSLTSLNDIAAAAATWATIEACQMVYQDWEEYHDPGEEGYFLDIWGAGPEHEELHTDVGAYDESIMRRLK